MEIEPNTFPGFSLDELRDHNVVPRVAGLRKGRGINSNPRPPLSAGHSNGKKNSKVAHKQPGCLVLRELTTSKTKQPPKTMTDVQRVRCIDLLAGESALAPRTGAHGHVTFTRKILPGVPLILTIATRNV